jgi:hypothetical protein
MCLGQGCLGFREELRREDRGILLLRRYDALRRELELACRRLGAAGGEEKDERERALARHGSFRILRRLR